MKSIFNPQHQEEYDLIETEILTLIKNYTSGKLSSKEFNQAVDKTHRGYGWKRKDYEGFKKIRSRAY